MSENEESQRSELNWFDGQVIFLTGGTGGLGGCLVYKLALQLPVRKIFVLCRVSQDRAIARWKENMPTHVSSILATKKIVFTVGDMKHPNYGIDDKELDCIRKETTIIIHCAANTSLTISPYEAVIENCLPVLELTKMALEFPKLSRFVHLSTAYANSFLPDGAVLERYYDQSGRDQCPENELSRILSNGSTPQTATFAWPCAQAKHLAERLINSRYPNLPVMIVRPSFIGPAIQYPYPLYDPNGTNPFSVIGENYLLDGWGNRVWHTAPGQRSATNIFDEIPVDLVANVSLLHIMLETRGIVQACAQLYYRCTGDYFIAHAKRHVPRSLKAKASCFRFTDDWSIPQCLFAEIYAVGTRDWRFDCSRSEDFKGKSGPLGLNLAGHTFEEYIAQRMKEIIGRVSVIPEMSKI